MVNKKSGLADKGSRLYLQQYMINAKDKLSEMILAASPSLLSFIENKNKIEWKSPLEKSEKGDFYEYRDDFLEVLGLNNKEYLKIKENLRGFWPKNGPQWDGLALVNGINEQNGFLLVEAKAHLYETKSDLKASSDSRILIENSLKIAQNHYGIDGYDWTKQYYQLGNRIAFLYFMNEVLLIPTWLVLVNFTDGEYKTTSIGQWLTHYHKVYGQMGIKHNNKLLNNVIQIFPKALNN